MKQKNMVRPIQSFHFPLQTAIYLFAFFNTYYNYYFQPPLQDLYSLRCSAIFKLNQAEKLKDCEEIYFPYNLDFRGRAYPIPPHLSNIGSDLCRGMLNFKKSNPLGERGLFWLKVHLANLAGADKMPFEARAAFTENNMDNIRAAAEDSFGDFLEGKGKW
jgi:DNA-directed RNA polymerase